MTIEEILEEKGVEFHASGHHHCRPGWIQIDCPWCGPDSQKFHLGFNLTSQYWNCWRCGGKRSDKVLEMLGIPRQEAREILRGVDTSPTIKRERTRISLQEPAHRGPLQACHREYLLKRGFDPRRIEAIWRVEGIGLAPRLGWRIYIPIIVGGVRVSWTTRAIGDRVTQRYISASAEEESVNHKTVVYGRDFCSHSVVIVEGPIDAWAVGPGGGALFGTAFSSSQVRELSKIPRRVICFDNSKEAQERAEELANQLSCFPGVTENVVLDAKDPGCASRKELRLLRKLAKL